MTYGKFISAVLRGKLCVQSFRDSKYTRKTFVLVFFLVTPVQQQFYVRARGPDKRIRGTIYPRELFGDGDGKSAEDFRVCEQRRKKFRRPVDSKGIGLVDRLRKRTPIRRLQRRSFNDASAKVGHGFGWASGVRAGGPSF